MMQSTTQFFKCHLSIASRLEINLLRRWSYLFSLLKTVSNSIWKSVLMLFPSNSYISVDLGCRQSCLFTGCSGSHSPVSLLISSSSLFSLLLFLVFPHQLCPISLFSLHLHTSCRDHHTGFLQTVSSQPFVPFGFHPYLTENSLPMAKPSVSCWTSG